MPAEYPILTVAQEINGIAPAERHAERIGELSALILGVDSAASAESKTFSFTPDPWNLTASDGTVLWSLSSIRVTYIRASDPVSGVPTSYVTLNVYATAHGWFMQPGGGHLHVLSQNSAGGVLEDWDTGPLDTNCSYNNKLFTYSKNFRPDWYDSQAMSVGVRRVKVGTLLWGKIALARRSECLWK